MSTRLDDLEALARAGPATWVGAALCFVSYAALLPPRIRLWARFAAQAMVIGFAAAIEVASGHHDWWSWSLGLFVGTWIPALRWQSQISRDQVFRVAQGMHGLLKLKDSNTRSFSLAGARFIAYRWQMARNATSWNLLWASSTFGRNLPSWLQTRERAGGNTAAIAAHLAGRDPIPVDLPTPATTRTAPSAPEPLPPAPVLDQMMRGLRLGRRRPR